jgi:hypothetical protein
MMTQTRNARPDCTHTYTAKRCFSFVLNSSNQRSSCSTDVDSWYFLSYTDEPHYNSFNADALAQGTTPVNFGESNNQADQFSSEVIYANVFEEEKKNMHFESWIRELDNYSFLCMT